MDGNYQQIKRSSEQTEMHRHTSMGTGVPTWMNARAHSPSHPPTDPDIHRCTHSCTSRWVWGRFRNRWASHSHVSQNSRHSRWKSRVCHVCPFITRRRRSGRNRGAKGADPCLPGMPPREALLSPARGFCLACPRTFSAKARQGV